MLKRLPRLVFPLFGLLLVGFDGYGSEPSEPLNARPKSSTPINDAIQLITTPANTITQIGQVADATITWQYSSFSNNLESRSYTVTTIAASVRIAKHTGSAFPNNDVTTTVRYECTSTGVVEAQIKLNIGATTRIVSWLINCVAPRVSVEPIEPSIAFIGATAESQLVWSYESLGKNAEELPFKVRSNDEFLRVEPSEGSALPDTEIDVKLRYTCQVSGAVTFQIGLQVGLATKVVEWAVTCTEEHVFIEIAPSKATAYIGGDAESELAWRFLSNGEEGGQIAYVINTDISGVTISNASGSVLPDATVNHKLAYRCTSRGLDEVQLTIAVENESHSIIWNVECKDERVAIISAPEPQKIEVGDSTIETLEWRFDSSAPNHQVRFEVTSPTRGLQIRNGSGDVLTGDVISTTLRFACNTRRSFAIELLISAGDARRTLHWHVDCAGEDLSQFVATLYQGPQISKLEFIAGQDSWEYVDVTQSVVSDQDALRFRTNRQLFVQIQTQHDELEPLPLEVSLVNPTTSVIGNQVGQTDTVTNNLESGPRYSSTFLFDIEAQAFDAYSELRVQIDPDSLYVEINERNNRASFMLDSRNTWLLPSFQLKLVPIRTSDGVPDLTDTSRFTRPIYELMPIGIVEVSTLDVLDVSDQSWSIDSGRLILDELYALFTRSADSDSYYLGVVHQPDRSVALCGNAFVDGKVSVIRDFPDRCSEQIAAHEIGHNFALKHAPACGAEDEDPDLDFPYIEGNIGSETGWLMKRRQFIDGGAPSEFVQLNYRYYDVMTYCPDTFTSQYSYKRALAYLNERIGVQASVKVGRPVASEFERVSGISVAVSGVYTSQAAWEIRDISLVEEEPLPFSIARTKYAFRIVDTDSGTIVHQERLNMHRAAHGVGDHVTWGVRVPYFDVDGMQLNVIDELGRVVLEHDFGKLLRSGIDEPM